MAGAGSLLSRFPWALRVAGLVGILLVLASACSSGASEDATRVASDPPAPMPEGWLGVRAGEGSFSLTLARTGEVPAAIASYPLASGPELDADPFITDVAYIPQKSSAWLAILGEPVSGTISQIDVGAPGQEIESADQGTAVDALADAYIRSDTFGSLALRVGEGGATELRAATGAIDVALSRAGGAIRYAALIDPDQLRFFAPTVPEGERELVVGELGEAGWTEQRFSLSEARPYCRLAFIAEGSAGLVRATEAQPETWTCLGSHLDVFHLGDGSLEGGLLEFPEPVRHVSADESSAYLIYTTVSGAVGWYSTEDGRGGELAPNGYHAADW